MGGQRYIIVITIDGDDVDSIIQHIKEVVYFPEFDKRKAFLQRLRKKLKKTVEGGHVITKINVLQKVLANNPDKKVKDGVVVDLGKGSFASPKASKRISQV